MIKDNMHRFLLSLDICIFYLIIFFISTSSGADDQYETCVPKNCGTGPDISFPFYIQGRQESYCGYPGFALNCGEEGHPILPLPGNYDFMVVENISYQNQSLLVYNAAVLRSNSSSCLPGIRNMTLPPARFSYADFQGLYLFSNCTEPLPEVLRRYRVACNNWTLALSDRDENLRIASENCERSVSAPVEGYRDGDNGNLVESLRRGFWLEWTASDCSGCLSSGGRCGFNETSYQFRCFCPEGPHSRGCRPGGSKRSRMKSRLDSILIPAILALCFLVYFLVYCKKRKYKDSKPENQKEIEIFLKNNGNLAIRRYKYSDLKKMTKSFSENLGNGGYGSVYKGILDDGHLVAVKILNESKGNGGEFMNEIASISRTSHVNIVSLLGFCFEGSKRALVYDFMPNGSLEKFIDNAADVVLGLEKLFEIAVGVARGLEYLHRGCNTRILHFDIKPHNILLDEDFEPKISDFGLAKLCPNRSSIVSMMVARGTIGYIAPEVFCRNFGEVSHKSDVYSYGMLVLGMAGVQKNIIPAVDQSSELYFPQYVYKYLEMHTELGIVDDEEESRFAERKMLVIGLWCTQTDPKDRPSMSKVVEMLEGELGSLQVPPKPHFSSPPNIAPNSFSTSQSV